MRLDLLGLELAQAEAILRSEGICPDVRITNAPKRTEETRGTLRVVHASLDGAHLTVARFLDPLADAEEKQETGDQ